MTVMTVSSREFNQDTGRAKIAARSGPVFITDRGRPVYVLLTIEDYQRLTGRHGNIVDLIALSLNEGDVEFGVAPSRDLARPPDLG
ncbi:type II toxin-antitoxin system Phd/YefM family antitoxin [Solwaraspora sp. WMMD791]|uniref:type II toxin-antitoxin system Phd/YefM family antitoxin n=1 Tax=Solwaraspora sp. WMMD791 TaxID=3016086 RepID=UPI00249C3134|nr:type II toxin-antitoxin system Phd/YefM family antitoxin [Solwaraspora sp. WMMD791]WFE26467.1 type II toxin-antitoxin system Phd/YefM family antitoxin [Solwaraspora sp. WMMD791]